MLINEKVKVRIQQFVIEITTPLRKNHKPYGITQYYLPPSNSDFPSSAPAETGTRFCDPGGCRAEFT